MITWVRETGTGRCKGVAAADNIPRAAMQSEPDVAVCPSAFQDWVVRYCTKVSVYREIRGLMTHDI